MEAAIERLTELFRAAIAGSDISTLLLLLHEPNTQFLDREVLGDAARVSPEVKAAVARHPRAPHYLRTDLLLSEITPTVAEDIAEHSELNVLEWHLLRAFTERIHTPVSVGDFVAALKYAEDLIRGYDVEELSSVPPSYFQQG